MWNFPILSSDKVCIKWCHFFFFRQRHRHNYQDKLHSSVLSWSASSSRKTIPWTFLSRSLRSKRKRVPTTTKSHDQVGSSVRVVYDESTRNPTLRTRYWDASSGELRDLSLTRVVRTIPSLLLQGSWHPLPLHKQRVPILCTSVPRLRFTPQDSYGSTIDYVSCFVFSGSDFLMVFISWFYTFVFNSSVPSIVYFTQSHPNLTKTR